MWELHRTAPLTHRTIDITKRKVENEYTPLRHERRTYLLVARDMPVVIYISSSGCKVSCRPVVEWRSGRDMKATGKEMVEGCTARMSR